MRSTYSEVRPREIPQSQDRFNFTLKLSDLANLESKTLFLCIRYNVNGQELWDNNSGTNFQIDFRKKMLPVNGKRRTDRCRQPSCQWPPTKQSPKQRVDCAAAQVDAGRVQRVR